MTDQVGQTPEYHGKEIRKFGRKLALAAVGLASLPVLLGILARPEGQTYLPFHLSLDDHMVYAAWMRQAIDGQTLFDNRFTTDPQPGLTFHLLFLLLGWIAKFVGVPLTLTLARIGFSYLAVRLLAEFIVRCGLQSFTGKFALATAVFGGGFAFLNWHTFGDAYTQGPTWLSSLLQGRQPIDNWQPEAFVFPSMLTNGLFMAALCLILWTLISVLDARSSWRPVIPGAIALGVLMNVHSYDVALLALILVAFVCTLFSSRQLEGKWAMRAIVIGMGALPAAMWFVYVLANDPVFKARAETLTYTTGFREILFGVLPLVLLALLALLRSDTPRPRKLIGGSLVLAEAVFLWIASSGARDGYALSTAEWVCALLIALAAAATVARKDVGWNLLWAWATVSLAAPYFPALFQRKLSMMLAVPWAILAAIGLANELVRMDRQPRNLVAALTLSVVCLTSVFWLGRDVELVRSGVSKTLVHNLYLTHDEGQIVQWLNDTGDGAGVLVMPGIMNPATGEKPYLADLSPVLSGLAGVHTFAGHWSETPRYNARRSAASSFFLTSMSNAERLDLLRNWGVTFVVAPAPETYVDLPLVDLSGLGDTVYDGDQLRLIRVRDR